MNSHCMAIHICSLNTKNSNTMTLMYFVEFVTNPKANHDTNVFIFLMKATS